MKFGGSIENQLVLAGAVRHSKQLKMIEESLKNLSNLESFNKEAFLADDKYSQELCNFVLALSLIWNDIKNLLLYYEYLKSLEPIDISKVEDLKQLETPFWGELSGIKSYLEKTLIAIIHELFKLIKNSSDVLESKAYKSILKQLHPNCRHAWEIIVIYALGGVKDKESLGKALLMVRHKIANHYDKDELFKGYKRKFFLQENIPYISRGNSKMKRRFYFADAAAQEYQRFHAEKVEIDKFYDFVNLIKNSVNLSIQNIVETFIQQRSPWREIK